MLSGKEHERREGKGPTVETSFDVGKAPISTAKGVRTSLLQCRVLPHSSPEIVGKIKLGTQVGDNRNAVELDVICFQTQQSALNVCQHWVFSRFQELNARN